MKKIYNYKKCVITVIIPDKKSNTVLKATENFIKKVMKEYVKNGNNNTSRTVSEK